MPDEFETAVVTTDAAPENAAALPEAATIAENAGAPGAPENVGEETDEQKNERVQREAEAERQKRAEKQSRGVQKRIDELTADKHAERKRADELAEQNRRILALLEGKGQATGPKADGAPQRENYGSWEEYVRADAAYVARQEAKTLFEESAKAQREANARMSQEQAVLNAQRSYATREAAVAKEIPDYREVMEDSEVSVPQGVLDTLRIMDDGPRIAYHLAKQPELAQQFWDKPQNMHGIILGQLSATLKATSSKASTAPAPGKTVQAKPAASSGPPSDPAAYIAWAEKHMPKGRSAK